MIVGILGCGAIANIILSNISYEDTGIDIKYFFDIDNINPPNSTIKKA